MFADKGYKTFGKSDESNAECALVYHRFDSVGGGKALGSVPKPGHQKRELLYKRGFLEIKTVAKLAGGNFEHIVELAEESVDTLDRVLDRHTFYCKTHDVDCRET